MTTGSSPGREAEESISDAHHRPGIDPLASIGDRARIDPLAVISRLVRVGTGSIVDSDVYIGPNVIIGRNCRLYHNAFVHESSHVEDSVSIGPGAMLINGVAPRPATSPGDAQQADASAHALLGVTVRTGAVIGAHAVCVAPVTIGRFAVIAARSVVTTDVPDFGLVAGAPAVQVGWVGHAGAKLQAAPDGTWRCPHTGERYFERSGHLQLLTSASGAA